ncbi:hypothetical protein O3G_MSEX010251 [Manduca sexta]|uniref:Cuticle protein n=1 Tax=Manduca sexta TaxID=7130 RepID=A0A922CT36_MANSE|nr:hypothetical protein O3G_MSEX010251 [Manduca sexta]
MFRFLVPLALLATASSVHIRSASPRYKSAASDSQIKFAVENKYDDTGPGAKQPEYAYNTYSNLEDALVGYLNDPDTKLPDFEREKAIERLTNPKPFYPGQPIERFLPKTVEEYTGYNKQHESRPAYVEKKVPLYYPESEPRPGLSAYEDNGLSLFNKLDKKPSEPYRLHKIQAVKGSPLSIAHYTRDPDYEPRDEFSHPKYSYSYGVHDKDTGDSKSAHERREGDTVHGFYSFIDADGKQRVVHYTADEHQGFRATVQRTSHH